MRMVEERGPRRQSRVRSCLTDHKTTISKIITPTRGYTHRILHREKLIENVNGYKIQVLCILLRKHACIRRWIF